MYNLIAISLLVSIIVISAEIKGKLSDEEIRAIFGTSEKPVPVQGYGIANITIPTGKDNINEIWQFPVKFNNGKVINLNLKLTDAILANEETPVWNAAGKSFQNSHVTYTRNYQAMNEVGEFSIYQDSANKAAVILFHDDNTIQGVVGYYEFRKYAFTPKYSGNTSSDIYLLVQSSNSPIDSEAGIASKPVLSGQLRQSRKPDIVYPELLIVLHRDYIRSGVRHALRKVLTYWNNVDMLYSTIKLPQIKLNIAGIIVPTNDYTTPWIKKADPNNTGIIIDSLGVYELGSHFSNYEKEFPDNSFDFIINMISSDIESSSGSKLAGIAYKNVNCGLRSERVGIVNYITGTYVSGAHELGHLLSAEHDQKIDKCKNDGGIMATHRTKNHASLQWSQCSLDYISEYFSHMESMCLDNCPKTVTNCTAKSITSSDTIINSQTTTETLSPNDVVPVCPIHPTKVCDQLGFNRFAEPIECDQLLLCGSPLENIPIKRTILPPDGSECNWDRHQKFTHVCYNKRCVQYNKSQHSNCP